MRRGTRPCFSLRSADQFAAGLLCQRPGRTRASPWPTRPAPAPCSSKGVRLRCPVMFTKGFVSAFAAGCIYAIGCSWLLEIVPAWWELFLVCGIGAFCSHVVWVYVRAMWLVVLDARPENRVENQRTQAAVDQTLALRGEPVGEPLRPDEGLRLMFFSLSLLWLFASRGLLAGTVLSALWRWFSG